MTACTAGSAPGFERLTVWSAPSTPGVKRMAAGTARSATTHSSNVMCTARLVEPCDCPACPCLRVGVECRQLPEASARSVHARDRMPAACCTLTAIRSLVVALPVSNATPVNQVRAEGSLHSVASPRVIPCPVRSPARCSSAPDPHQPHARRWPGSRSRRVHRNDLRGTLALALIRQATRRGEIRHVLHVPQRKAPRVLREHYQNILTGNAGPADVQLERHDGRIRIGEQHVVGGWNHPRTAGIHPCDCGSGPSHHRDVPPLRLRCASRPGASRRRPSAVLRGHGGREDGLASRRSGAPCGGRPACHSRLARVRATRIGGSVWCDPHRCSPCVRYRRFSRRMKIRRFARTRR